LGLSRGGKVSVIHDFPWCSQYFFHKSREFLNALGFPVFPDLGGTGGGGTTTLRGGSVADILYFILINYSVVVDGDN
jgi:hypothetical protein